jgi:hypothetical protein
MFDRFWLDQDCPTRRQTEVKQPWAQRCQLRGCAVPIRAPPRQTRPFEGLDHSPGWPQGKSQSLRDVLEILISRANWYRVLNPLSAAQTP